MGRKPIGNPTIVVGIDDKVLAWTDGHTGGDREFVKQAQLLSEYGSLVQIPATGYSYIADLDNTDNRVGAIAALMGVNPGRARLLTVDEETLQMLVEGVGAVL